MYKMIVIVRNDLKMPKGKLCAQVSHAVLNSGMKQFKRKKDIFTSWENEGSKKVILKVNSLDEILKLKNLMDRENITNALIKDAGKTFFDSPTITVLAVGPQKEDLLDRFFNDLKLL
ncbi:MAG: peptidyl-tRNA hydrolase Pth2 [Candidatus Woesearchaeota archaeon]